MDTDSGGIAPAPHGRVSSRASSALAALSVLVVLLYLVWRFIWQCRKHGTRSNATGGATSSARPLSCPPRDAAAAYGPPRATTASPLSLSVSVPVATARSGADGKVECAVCLAEPGDGEAATRLVLGCGHGFHAECIQAWFRVSTTCPLCRAAAPQSVPRYDISV
ncbi:E3 ubiquitin-protein ligase EL5 [Zea mays]|jgi:hypothetical protein|uniref:RING-type E3 ubiquitin transferase n=1 Tax=Zea mays TaxID=4577 RepID=A0A1D6K2D5_MAIZE|nr:E3 ubiquitin-protein ligase EL5 [Zea mays]ONL97847.1 RING-H2 finger protein ATL3 [Zea mays]|eukprot:XP_008655414.1 E3 ubiquitin-protein ligase EL5 [Zea mays]